MAQVIWTRGALEDVDAIAAYIALDSSFRAGHQVLRILSTETLLQQFPGAGRMVPEIQDQRIREVIMPPYRIIYHYDKPQSRAGILAVIHSKRKLRPSLIRGRA